MKTCCGSQPLEMAWSPLLLNGGLNQAGLTLDCQKQPCLMWPELM
jgi:hypothetical protein